MLLGSAALALAAPAAADAAPDPLAELKDGCDIERSEDPRPSLHRVCTGAIRSFDGTTLDATLTLPAGPRRRGRLPLVVFLHGFLADKGEYLSRTRAGTGADRGANAYKTVRWNNLWFASRGYAVLNYSARGHGESEGEIGLASKRLEVRDTRELTGLLVDDRDSRRPLARIARKRVAVLGSSYGGGQTWMLLATRGQGAKRHGTWRSPAGRLVKLAAAVPQYTWTDLLYALVPSGHHREATVRPLPPTGPIGVGKQTLIDGFIATAGPRLSAETLSWLVRFNAGEPYDGDPVIEDAARGLTRERSAYHQRGYFRALRRGRARRVPILAAQGWTDPIFSAIEPLRMYRELRRREPGYPISLYLGDFEHLTSQVKIPDLRRFHRLGTRMLDHYLRGRGRRPRPSVRSAVTDCRPDRFGPVLKARSWARLHPRRRVMKFGGQRTTTSPVSDPRGPEVDPVAVSQTEGRGCITTERPPPPLGVAVYRRPVERAMTMAGLPKLRLDYRTAAPDVQLNSRLWDLAPDGTYTLVDRGAYRAIGSDPAGERVTYELFGNAWRFRAGHTIVLEVIQDDSTYLRRDNFPSAVTIDAARLTLPLARRARRAG